MGELLPLCPSSGNGSVVIFSRTVPNLFALRHQFHGWQFFHRPGWGGWFHHDSITLHLLCTLFPLLLYHLHLRSSGIRSQRLGTPALKNPRWWDLRNLVFLQLPNSERAWGRIWGGEGARCRQGGAGRWSHRRLGSRRPGLPLSRLQHAVDSRGCRGDSKTAGDTCGSLSHTAAVAAADLRAGQTGFSSCW